MKYVSMILMQCTLDFAAGLPVPARPSVRPRKPRRWRDVFTIRLLYID